MKRISFSPIKKAPLSRCVAVPCWHVYHPQPFEGGDTIFANFTLPISSPPVSKSKTLFFCFYKQVKKLFYECF